MRRRQFANVMRRALDFIDPPYDQTIRVVSSTGTVLDGTASAVTASYDRTVRIVDSTGHVIDSFGGGGGGPVTSATVTLTSAQIKALDLTPVTIVAAQGANKIVIPTAILFQGKFGTIQYVTPTTVSLKLAYNAISLNNAIVSYGEGTPSQVITAASSLSSYLPAFHTGAGGGGWAGANVGTPQASSYFANQPVLFGPVSTQGTFNAGPITTMTVATAGLGYAVNDTFTIDAAGAKAFDTNDATGHVTSIGAGGAVTGVAIDAAGFSYGITTANPASGPYPTAHTSGAGNDALTVNVTGATVGDGTAVITVWYYTGTLQ